MQGELPTIVQVIWVSAVLMLSGAQLVQLARWDRAPTDAESYRRDYRSFARIYVLMGAFWGTAAAFIPQFSTSEMQLFTMLLLVAASASCVPGYSLALRPTWLVLSLVLLPTVPAFGSRGDMLGYAIAVGAVGYLLFLMYLARLTNRSHERSFHNQFANEAADGVRRGQTAQRSAELTACRPDRATEGCRNEADGGEGPGGTGGVRQG